MPRAAARNPSQEPLPRRVDWYEQPSAAQLNVGLWVSAVGFQHADLPRGVLKNRVLHSYGALWITRGRGCYESAPTGRVELPPGSLLWLFPEIPHAYHSVDGPWAEQWVLFGGELAETWRLQGVLNPGQPVVAVGVEARVADLYAKLQETFERSGPLAVPLAAALVHQLVVTVHGIATGLLESPGAADATVTRALQVIESEACGGLRPDDLAARLHVGYSTLRRRFRRQTGYTLKEYVLRVQLKRAKRLLALTARPVTEVALEAGFEDPLYFSKVFHRREGVPPTAFRAQHGR
ncbi:MAG: AraC family transcriptional regulator [Planctomycetota bacterium]|nr:AraC family transcriptional regulator [Planctomycetota bacterium]